MKYFKLLYDYENDNDAICCISNELNGIDQYVVEKGIFIKNWNMGIILFYNPKEGTRKTDFLGNDLGWLIVSAKLKNILEENFITGIQYLPIKIINALTNENLENYFVANIYNLVDAIDLANSKYDIFVVGDNEKIITIEKYALKKEKIIDVDIFKLKDDTIPKFISEKVVNLIQENNLTGCSFLEVKVT
ncbi:MAG: maleate cis-trans isomerase [Tissierellia bacterium]|jgi:hypothetical protein|nr:maleate cis-trans isomerase [Tissierellia bacterium]